jgi:hypothetical protein
MPAMRGVGLERDESNGKPLGKLEQATSPFARHATVSGLHRWILAAMSSAVK